jgi:hypothetical protein
MDALDQFYADLNAGIPAATFLDRYPGIIDFIHAAGLTHQMRLARGRVKKLRDEVAPFRRLLLMGVATGDSVQFPLDDGPIDCNWIRSGKESKKVQVTIAQGVARFHVMTELNQKGRGRGYLGITDDRPESEFKRAMARERIAYPTTGAQRTLVASVALRLKKKFRTKGATTLLIEAPLNNLPVTRVQGILLSRKYSWLELESGRSAIV